MERLQRVMAARGAGSRRRAEELIVAGRVSVDGAVVTELGTKVDPQTSQIHVDGKLLRRQAPRYLLLNKPRGYITTVSDERDRQTVMELIQVPERVYPVGRLDRQTEGLLLFTNDGDVANRVMHPRYGLEKEYNVLTLSRPTETTLQRLRDGLVIDGKRVVPAECRILRETHDGLILKIVIHEGMFHVVRRLMEEVAIPVTRLRRVRVGPLTLQNIPVGVWRDLTTGEVNNLYQALHLEREADAAAAPGWRAARRSPPPSDAATAPPPTRPTVRPNRPPGRENPPSRRDGPPPAGGQRRPPAAPGSPRADTRPPGRSDRRPPAAPRAPGRGDDRPGRRAPGGPASRTPGGPGRNPSGGPDRRPPGAPSRGGPTGSR